MNWNELSIQEKADLIKLYVANGITSLDTIKEHYNSFQDGSLMKLKDTEPNFVTRLKQGNSRKSIIDNEGNPASHKLSVADSRVYAGVQEDEKGNLVDYGAIPYRPFYAYERAIKNKDYVEFPDDESAVNFTEHYKNAAVYPWYGTFDNYYPWRYQKGGYVYTPPSLFATSNISSADNTRTNINQEIANIVAAREAKKQAAEQAYLNRRGYISEDRDKRSYTQRDIDAKIAATKNAKTDFYQMAATNAQSTDVTPGQVLLPAAVAGTTFAAPLTSLAYGAMYEPMEKAGVYQPVSLGLQKLGVNENTANIISPFVTDPLIGSISPITKGLYNSVKDNNLARSFVVSNELRKGVDKARTFSNNVIPEKRINYDFPASYLEIPTLQQAYFEGTLFKDLFSKKLALPQFTDIRPQIKPLVKADEIEKQLSKEGTINRKSLNSYINKQGKRYQEIMNEVLDQEFKDVDRIDYSAFKDAVQKRLPEYKRVPSREYEDYGIDRLGYYLDQPPALSTFTFEAPGITGNTKHYEGNPIGHSRTYTTKEEPDVLHVMESQSDWAQAPKDATSTEKRQLEQLNRLIEDTENLIRQKEELDIDVTTEREDLKELLEEKDFVEKNVALRKGNNVEELMKDTYTERQIQENLKYAVEKGQTKMRYPTRETAAKIEGYSKHIIPTDEIATLRKELRKIDDDQTTLQHTPMAPGELTGFQSVQAHIAKIMQSDEYRQLTNKAKELRQKLIELEKNQPLVYYPEHETILKKYDAFPKQYQKLFGKNTEVRTVTDSKGNTWYEVDIPESYKNKTGQIVFANGGHLGHITPYGQWQYPHQITTIPSNNITMKGVDYPVIGVSNTGDTKIMFPDLDYTFNGNYVTEYPINK